jgi:hypothetical protein
MRAFGVPGEMSDHPYRYDFIHGYQPITNLRQVNVAARDVAAQATARLRAAYGEENWKHFERVDAEALSITDKWFPPDGSAPDPKAFRETGRRVEFAGGGDIGHRAILEPAGPKAAAEYIKGRREEKARRMVAPKISTGSIEFVRLTPVRPRIARAGRMPRSVRRTRRTAAARSPGRRSAGDPEPPPLAAYAPGRAS